MVFENIRKHEAFILEVNMLCLISGIRAPEILYDSFCHNANKLHDA